MEKEYKWDIPKLKKLAQKVNEADMPNTNYIDEVIKEFEKTIIYSNGEMVTIAKDLYLSQLEPIESFIRQALEKQQKHYEEELKWKEHAISAKNKRIEALEDDNRKQRTEFVKDLEQIYKNPIDNPGLMDLLGTNIEIGNLILKYK